MKLKAGFYMEDDGTIWLVYPDGECEYQACLIYYDRTCRWIYGSPTCLKSAKKTYIGL